MVSGRKTAFVLHLLFNDSRFLINLMISVDYQCYYQSRSLGVRHQRSLFCTLVQVCVWILCWENVNAVTCVAACSLTQGDHLLWL